MDKSNISIHYNNCTDKSDLIHVFLLIKESVTQDQIIFIQQYIKYFQDEDKITLFIKCNNNIINKLKNIIYEANSNNIADSLPKIIFAQEFPSLEESKMHIDANELILTHKKLPYWTGLYEAYTSFTMGNSIFETKETSNWYNTKHIIQKAIENPNDPDLITSTFNSTYDIEFINFIKYYNIQSILDIGCGSGSFYHLLRSLVDFDIKYKGYDISRNQILNAIKNFGNNLFDVKDIAKINKHEFSQYKALHCYSVFAFMPISSQLLAIKNIFESNTNAFLVLSATDGLSSSIPNTYYTNFSNTSIGGEYIYTPIYNLFLDKIIDIIEKYNYKYSYSIKTKKVNKAMIIDNNDNVNNKTILVNSNEHENIKNTKEENKLNKYEITIVPKEWNETKKSLGLDFEEQYKDKDLRSLYLNALVRDIGPNLLS